ncbi:MAG TPA: NAD(P)-dependent oxidoreductase [Solirubrobacteraceae bacterium]|nr:NAD(P)-dependent oxidoreductase [Solirubrobacteraceae bacterium]
MRANGPITGRVLITGAAGAIGSCLREGLRAQVGELVLTDARALGPSGNERFIQADLADRDTVMRAAEGVDAVIHLGAIPTEASFDELLGPNLIGTFNVFEAARRAGARRVVFASSNHATGFYPVEQRLSGRDAPRPDTLYGVTKAYGEALGSLYADKFGLEVICIRIGSFGERPRQVRELATWLSLEDAVRLFAACLSAPSVGFRVIYGASANTRLNWDLSAARELGYEPQDDAERFVADLSGEPHQSHGGSYTDRDIGGWA